MTDPARQRHPLALAIAATIAMLALAGCEPPAATRPSADSGPVSQPTPLVSAPPVEVSDLPPEISAPIKAPSNAPLPAEGDVMTAGEVLDRLRARLSTPTCIVGPNNTRWRHKYAGYPRHFAQEVQDTLPMMLVVLDQLEQNKLPGEFALIPIVESWYRTDVHSFGGAAGMWQMLAETSRNNGATVVGGYDGRLSALDSTEAALNYLGKLHAMFNDWRLTAMAYNSGEYRLMRTMSPDELAARGAGGVHYRRPNGLSTTTYEYVSKMRALTCLLAQPERQGIPFDNSAPVQHWVPYTIPADIDSLDELAERLGTDAEALRNFNRGYHGGRIVADAPRMLLVPASTRSRWGSAGGTAVNLPKAPLPAGGTGQPPAPPRMPSPTFVQPQPQSPPMPAAVSAPVASRPSTDVKVVSITPLPAATTTPPAASPNTSTTTAAPSPTHPVAASAPGAGVPVPAPSIRPPMQATSPATSPSLPSPSAGSSGTFSPPTQPASPSRASSNPAAPTAGAAGSAGEAAPKPGGVPAAQIPAAPPAAATTPATPRPAPPAAASQPPKVPAAQPKPVAATTVSTPAPAAAVAKDQAPSAVPPPASQPTKPAPEPMAASTAVPGPAPAARIPAAVSTPAPATPTAPPPAKEATAASATRVPTIAPLAAPMTAPMPAAASAHPEPAAPAPAKTASPSVNPPKPSESATAQPTPSQPAAPPIAPRLAPLATPPRAAAPPPPAAPPQATAPAPPATPAADIHPAPVATPPPPHEPRTHRVRIGDSIESIAQHYGLKVEDLRAWNHLDADTRLFVDQELKLEP